MDVLSQVPILYLAIPCVVVMALAVISIISAVQRTSSTRALRKEVRTRGWTCRNRVAVPYTRWRGGIFDTDSAHRETHGAVTGVIAGKRFWSFTYTIIPKSGTGLGDCYHVIAIKLPGQLEGLHLRSTSNTRNHSSVRAAQSAVEGRWEDVNRMWQIVDGDEVYEAPNLVHTLLLRDLNAQEAIGTDVVATCRYLITYAPGEQDISAVESRVRVLIGLSDLLTYFIWPEVNQTGDSRRADLSEPPLSEGRVDKSH